MPPKRSSARVSEASPSASRASARQTATANAGKPSIRLTVKAQPSKLRQALSGDDLPPYPYSEEIESPEPPIRNARSTRNPKVVIDPDSDEEMDDAEAEDDEDGQDNGDEDGEDDQDDEEDEDEDEDDAEGEEDDEEDAEADDDEDSDMEDAQGDVTMAESPHPPPPIIKTSKGPGGKAKIDIKVTAPAGGALKSVEAKEEELDDLSDLGSDEEDADGDTDEELDENGERAGTPNLEKLTRRQRAAYEENLEGGLMALSNEAQKKKHLTAEEHAMRRAEMARRRKNLSEKRNEEEKMDTINKLLKKPAPKRRTRAEMIAAANAAEAGEDGDEFSADPLYVRWVNNSAGSRIGVPTEWLEGAPGQTLSQGWTKPPEAKLVEEVQ
ncbi:PAPA-1-like conserved region-domain-containing protein [Elsinoe ampelina]|uniref:PAPA-1-like conserved region-domain-containing protein n=1 Tax=Elsinoe ampelina TaxID=302913 RepID=A0A6A6FYB7_9PEZI|nr:PAPA-1-like conserved region-domain-containing protein [Elsinoe ampelina]